MSDDFIDYLTSIQASRDTIHQGLRLYLAERTDDLPVEQMRRQLGTSVSEQELEQSLQRLTSDSELTEEAALAVLSAEWETPSHRPAIRSALENARKKLPVVEAAVIATAAMYGMYLVATGGKHKVTRVRRDEKKGTYVREVVEFASPKSWLTTLLGLLKRPHE
jgi:hypothetical protein